MNVIARLEFELTFYDSTVHCFNHYTTWTPPLFDEVLPSYTLRMVPNILHKEEPVYSSLFWDFCYRLWFRTVFSFFGSIISSPLICRSPLPVFPSICTFPFLKSFWFFLDLVVLFLPSFVVYRNEGVLRIPPNLNITRTSHSDSLASYQDTRCGGGSYHSAAVQSVYSTATADWTKN